eukprot:Skav208131  [mRNA]  locus=scaffold1223:206167:211776:- [translate_table: standard]
MVSWSRVWHPGAGRIVAWSALARLLLCNIGSFHGTWPWLCQEASRPRRPAFSTAGLGQTAVIGLSFGCLQRSRCPSCHLLLAPLQPFRLTFLSGYDGKLGCRLTGQSLLPLAKADHPFSFANFPVCAIGITADHRVVLEEERAVLQEDRRMQPHCLRQQVSPTLGFSPKKEQYLRFLQKEIAAQRAFLRDIKSARKDQAGHLHKLMLGSTRLQSLVGWGGTHTKNGLAKWVGRIRPKFKA